MTFLERYGRWLTENKPQETFRWWMAVCCSIVMNRPQYAGSHFVSQMRMYMGLTDYQFSELMGSYEAGRSISESVSQWYPLANVLSAPLDPTVAVVEVPSLATPVLPRGGSVTAPPRFVTTAGADAEVAELKNWVTELKETNERLNEKHDDLELRHEKLLKALKEIGNIVGCDHTDDPDGQAKLVTCVRQTIEAPRPSCVNNEHRNLADKIVEGARREARLNEEIGRLTNDRDKQAQAARSTALQVAELQERLDNWSKDNLERDHAVKSMGVFRKHVTSIFRGRHGDPMTDTEMVEAIEQQHDRLCNVIGERDNAVQSKNGWKTVALIAIGAVIVFVFNLFRG